MRTIKIYVALSLVAFILNLGWEHLMLPLYSGYAALGSGWRLNVWAAGWDVFYVLVITVLVALQKRDKEWMLKQRARDFSTSALLAFLVALFVEYKALYLGRWGYSPLMPIIPLLGVGLTPVIQMSVLAPFSAWAATLVEKRFLVYSQHESI